MTTVKEFVRNSKYSVKLACKAGGFAGGMIRKQRLRTTGRHFERANKGETGERKKEKGRGWGRGKRREEGGGLGVFQLLLPKPLAAAPLAVAASPLLLVRAKPNNTASYAG